MRSLTTFLCTIEFAAIDSQHKCICKYHYHMNHIPQNRNLWRRTFRNWFTHQLNGSVVTFLGCTICFDVQRWWWLLRCLWEDDFLTSGFTWKGGEIGRWDSELGNDGFSFKNRIFLRHVCVCVCQKGKEDIKVIGIFRFTLWILFLFNGSTIIGGT